MLSANQARKLSKQDFEINADEILEDIECQIRKVATLVVDRKKDPQRYVNYFNVDWRKEHETYNTVIAVLEAEGYEVEYVPSFDDRDPRDVPYLTIKW